MNINPLNPNITLVCKLGSIARHAEEAIGDDSHPADLLAIRGLLADPEVQEWMGAMDVLHLLPVAR